MPKSVAIQAVEPETSYTQADSINEDMVDYYDNYEY